MFKKIRDRAFIAEVTRVREENKDKIAGFRIGLLLKKYASPVRTKPRAGYGASLLLEDVPLKDRRAFLAELGVPTRKRTKLLQYLWPHRAATERAPSPRPRRRQDRPAGDVPSCPAARGEGLGIVTATPIAFVAHFRLRLKSEQALDVAGVSLVCPWLVLSGLWIVGVCYAESLDGLLFQELGEVLTTSLAPTILPPVLLAVYVQVLAARRSRKAAAPEIYPG